MAVCLENHTKHMIALWRQTVEVLNVTNGGMLGIITNEQHTLMAFVDHTLP